MVYCGAVRSAIIATAWLLVEMNYGSNSARWSYSYYWTLIWTDIVSHGLQMILCQQSAFIISAVLASTLKYIFHSKFWCSASMLLILLVLENYNFRSLRSPWQGLEFCPFSLLWTLQSTVMEPWRQVSPCDEVVRHWSLLMLSSCTSVFGVQSVMLLLLVDWVWSLGLKYMAILTGFLRSSGSTVCHHELHCQSRSTGQSW